MKVSGWHGDTLREGELGIGRMPPCLQLGDQLTLFGKQGFANPGAVTSSYVLLPTLGQTEGVILGCGSCGPVESLDG